MAVIYSHREGDRCYLVRTAGSSKRLYTNGVFHSQWNLRRPLGGAVWDLLSLPILYLPRALEPSIRVLLLGVGGGAVIQQLQVLVSQPMSTGIELDPLHLQLAEKYFEVNSSVATLHCADAVQWVDSYRGPSFDYVIDDLFSHNNGEPERAVAMDQEWADALLGICDPHGAVVANFASGRELRSSALMGRAFKRIYHWSQPEYDNAVGVFLRSAGDARSWRASVDRHERLSRSQKRVAMQCQRRKIA